MRRSVERGWQAWGGSRRRSSNSGGCRCAPEGVISAAVGVQRSHGVARRASAPRFREAPMSKDSRSDLVYLHPARRTAYKVAGALAGLAVGYLFLGILVFWFQDRGRNAESALAWSAFVMTPIFALLGGACGAYGARFHNPLLAALVGGLVGPLITVVVLAGIYLGVLIRGQAGDPGNLNWVGTWCLVLVPPGAAGAFIGAGIAWIARRRSAAQQDIATDPSREEVKREEV